MAQRHQATSAIYANAEYREAVELEQSFQRRFSDADRELTLVIAEESAQRGTLRTADLTFVDRLRGEFEDGEGDVPAADQDRLAIETGKLLLDGGGPPRTKTTAERVELLLTYRSSYHQAFLAQAQVVRELKGRLSFEEATRLKAQHRQHLLKAYRLLEEASRALLAEQNFRQEIADRGFEVRTDLLPRPAGSLLAVIGLESDFNSRISMFRRQLETAGVL